MNLHNLSKFIDVRVAYNGAAAGTSDTLTGTAIDTLGWDGILFLFGFGTITSTAVTTIKLQYSDASNGSSAADIAGTSQSIADDSDNKIAGVEIFHPKQRYVLPIITRATANAVVNPVIAILYRGEICPVTVHSTVVRAIETFNSPAAGTA